MALAATHLFRHRVRPAIGRTRRRGDARLVFPAALTHHLVERPVHRAAAMLKRMAGALPCRGRSLHGCGARRRPGRSPRRSRTSRLPRRAKRWGESHRSEPIQETAKAIRPNPVEAALDKGRLADDGCLVERPVLESGECTYGPDDRSANVFLLGDSHGQQYFPALERIGRDKGWRITGLTKVGCTPASISVWSGSLRARIPSATSGARTRSSGSSGRRPRPRGRLQRELLPRG